MAALTEWLQIMLGEIARKRDDVEQARAEEARRATEERPPSAPSSGASVTKVHEARAARR
jgi:hypothetical protein